MFNFKHTFYVEGEPATRGEKIHIIYKNGFPIPQPYTEAGSPADLWKKAVASVVRGYMNGRQLIGGVKCGIEFHMPRPKAHYSKSKSAKAGHPVLIKSAPMIHCVTPDLDNLLKLTIDGIAKDRGPKTKDGIFLVGDQQIYDLVSIKKYGDAVFIGAIITIEGTLV